MSRDSRTSRIHGGHRGRMRGKLSSYGHGIFDAYELLEMLLYEAVPCIDTNPIAKRLLHRFGTLDALFSADALEIAAVRGVGAECASIIKSVGELQDLLGIRLSDPQSRLFDRYTIAGEHFVKHFSGSQRYGVAVALLDNGMRLLDFFTAYWDTDYANAKVQVGDIVKRALDSKATAVISSHNHPFGPLFPSPEDMETNRALTDALTSLGILHLEHFVVCGGEFVGIMSHLKERFVASMEIYRFLESRERAIADGSARGEAEEVRE